MSFTTDYGTRDGFVAACKGVAARLAPDVRILDITHEIPPQDVTAAAAVMAQTVPYLPTAVHLVVVDPGVGTQRRGVALATPEGPLVGPDNGVLLPAAEALGGITMAVALTEPRWWLGEVSATFHGRDVFAPVAAALARGVQPHELGRPLDVAELVTAERPRATVDGDTVSAPVLTRDHFGNLQLPLEREHIPWQQGRGLLVHSAHTTLRARMVRTFAEVGEGEGLVLADSAGMLAVAVNTGSAAETLDADHGTALRITGEER